MRIWAISLKETFQAYGVCYDSFRSVLDFLRQLCAETASRKSLGGLGGVEGENMNGEERFDEKAKRRWYGISAASYLAVN